LTWIGCVGYGQTPLRAYVRQMLERCAVGGGYALGSGNTITNYTPIENYLAMLEEGEKYQYCG